MCPCSGRHRPDRHRGDHRRAECVLALHGADSCVQHSRTNRANHAYGIDQVTCTATKGEIAGIKEKDGVATEFAEATGNASKGHGIFVETLANGDKVTVVYQFTGTMNNNQFVSGSNTWTATGGAGKVKGMTGKGTCKAKGNPDGTADFDCTGTYSIPK